MPEKRLAVHAWLTVPAHETWHAIAEEAGISLAGFMESLAADFKNHPPENGERWTDIVRAARKIDVQQRRRGGPS
jgi:hypothetical protein